MPETTQQYYRNHARELAEVYARAGDVLNGTLVQAFSRGDRVLDVGCGSGRDLSVLLELGIDAHGVDVCEEWFPEVELRYPDTCGRLIHDSLPELGKIADQAYDGILCSAVLMHIPEEQLFDTVYSLRRVMKSGGRLLISTPLVGPPVNSDTLCDEHGRLFNQVTPENFQLLFEKVGFRLMQRWDSADSLNRSQRSWSMQLFVLENHGSRSLDRIEGILNKDKKDATYKPALFRALSELAMKNYNAVVWLPGGKVSIPIEMIAEKWLTYYWPIVESGLFIPQKRGEKPGCQKPMAFRSQLADLVKCYAQSGGLSGFVVDYRNRSVPEDCAKALSKLLSKLKSTIKDGPVCYAGPGKFSVFQYDSKSKSVIMDADLWRELSMMGAWIADATVLRWAELTAEISQGSLRPSQVIDQLLSAPDVDREVGAARRFYLDLPDKVCVWTDQSLTKGFDVDHAIPFSLWKNNDLWNLFPADPRVNNGKRDRPMPLN